MKVLVTGSSGLIGSEAVEYYDAQGNEVTGIDNNLRRDFFGPKGDTSWNLERLKRATHRFQHVDLDIRDRDGVLALFKASRFDLIIHCAAQPSHDKACEIPFIDFDVNAVGTLNLLEATRQRCPDAVFIHMSTNKVYGDAPNELPMVETKTRYDYSRPEDRDGIDETCRVDRCLHSLFGASKTAGDIVAQEYGRYFGMKIGIFRGGCLTGPAHSAVELHGFLSYLVHVAVAGEPYTIFGYKGKQVRDQIHSYDVIQAFEAFASDPRPGEVYNIGGGRENAASVLECIQLIEEIGGYKAKWSYQEQNRIGDHICYISNLSKLKSHYPEWDITRSLRDITAEMIHAEEKRLKK
ncbi:MAG: NAD-dependent epimerase/dehydratase family protein [Deltaproteobacteria bacterium]|nr:NAD-dependent epimerase/dehydratase family protein [Deltaproteobacteria bacterium]